MVPRLNTCTGIATPKGCPTESKFLYMKLYEPANSVILSIFHYSEMPSLWHFYLRRK
ncbi:hypothetical protein KSU1_C1298 [Candidatus Jettenia caeni]|uniref:Uncharacterized protein n=1 Tax=Candidatus Jettenia caeni TaxID=247490 RepID=I3IME9_9BACT|nr:hypothetical protein KSU1_C1298 [Candidatus Jettenia caeni]